MSRLAAAHLDLAHALADAAGAVQRRYFRTPVAVDSKPDESPVTIADREAEAAMRDLLRVRAPGHGVFGEEYGVEAPDAELVWVIDPIDGTKSFICGRPLFGTLIALLHHGRPILGVIDQAILGERWIGADGAPTTHNGRAVSVRPCTELGEAVLFVTSPRMFGGFAERAAYQRVEDAVRLPMFGGDCYAYGLLAMGFADLVVEADLEPYDFMALVPIVSGAGGLVTDWEGRALTLQSDGRTLAAGDRRVHSAALELLRLA